MWGSCYLFSVICSSIIRTTGLPTRLSLRFRCKEHISVDLAHGQPDAQVSELDCPVHAAVLSQRPVRGAAAFEQLGVRALLGDQQIGTEFGNRSVVLDSA